MHIQMPKFIGHLFQRIRFWRVLPYISVAAILPCDQSHLYNISFPHPKDSPYHFILIGPAVSEKKMSYMLMGVQYERPQLKYQTFGTYQCHFLFGFISVDPHPDPHICSRAT